MDEIKTLNLIVDSKFDSLNPKLDTFVSKTEHEIKNIRENITRSKQSQRFIGDQYEKYRTEQNNIIKSHTQISQENEEINTKVKRLEKELKEERIKRNKLEQHGLLNQVKINGIPLKEHESCKGTVLEIANWLMQILCRQILMLHRDFPLVELLLLSIHVLQEMNSIITDSTLKAKL